MTKLLFNKPGKICPILGNGKASNLDKIVEKMDNYVRSRETGYTARRVVDYRPYSWRRLIRVVLIRRVLQK